MSLHQKKLSKINNNFYISLSYTNIRKNMLSRKKKMIRVEKFCRQKNRYSWKSHKTIKMESRDETNELQQLVSSDVENEGDDIAQDSYTISRDEKIISPVRSTKISSGETSQSSMTRSVGRGFLGIGSNSARVAYINEKRLGRDSTKTATARPRNVHKVPERKVQHHCFLSEVPDVRHMERALIGLLDDFHSGKLRAFGKGCSMEQMTDIREQQERLARLHFDLGATISTTDPPLSAEGLKHSHTTMAQLVQRLEQLSVSIEKLHSSDK